MRLVIAAVDRSGRYRLASLELRIRLHQAVPHRALRKPHVQCRHFRCRAKVHRHWLEDGSAVLDRRLSRVKIPDKHQDVVIATGTGCVSDVLSLRRLMRPLSRQVAQAITLRLVSESIECNNVDVAATRLQPMKPLEQVEHRLAADAICSALPTDAPKRRSELTVAQPPGSLKRRVVRRLELYPDQYPLAARREAACEPSDKGGGFSGAVHFPEHDEVTPACHDFRPAARHGADSIGMGRMYRFARRCGARERTHPERQREQPQSECPHRPILAAVESACNSGFAAAPVS